MKHKMVIEITRDELEWLLSGYPDEEDAEKLWMMLRGATPLEKVFGEIKGEIDNQYKWLMQTKCTLADIDIAFDAVKKSIDSHISGKEEE